MTATIPKQLLETIKQSSSRSPSAAVNLLGQKILATYGDAVQGILFYGSCLNKTEDLNGLFDLYVLVDSYRSVNRNSLHAIFNTLLPPNVFYLEAEYEQRTIRSKYAILSMSDLQKGTSFQWFHSYLWARFCQPTLIVYAKDQCIAEQINSALAQAVITFLSRALPRMRQDFTVRELWQKGLELTYRSEFRPEQADKQVRLFDSRPDYFEKITRNALPCLKYKIEECHDLKPTQYNAEIRYSTQLFSALSWAVRIVQGKLLSVSRLIKGSLTFDGGVEYILWKINRHSGVTVDVGPFLKRHPVLAMLTLSLKLYRRGGIK